MCHSTLNSLQVLMQSHLQRYIYKASLIIPIYYEGESICVSLPNLLGTICIFGKFHIVFSGYLASSQQVFNIVLFMLLVSVVICNVKAAICARFSQTAGKPQFFLSSSFKVRSSSDIFLGIYY